MIVFVRGSILATAASPVLDHPNAAVTGGDADRLDTVHAPDKLVRSGVDPVDALVGADHPDRIACHRNVLQRAEPAALRVVLNNAGARQGDRVNNDARIRVEARDALRVARRRERELAKGISDPERPGTRGDVGRGRRGAEGCSLWRQRLLIDGRDCLVVRVEHPDRPGSDGDARRCGAERDAR